MLGTTGKKTVVMTKKQFLAHPNHCFHGGNYLIYNDKSWLIKNVIISDL